MFSGIIEDIGTIESITKLDDSIQLEIQTKVIDSETKLGDSISVNGVCLTVTSFETPESATPDPDSSEQSHASFRADVMQESLDRTALGSLNEGSPVNIERAMPANARLDGHIVQGHVDATGTLVSRKASENWEVFRFSYPADLACLLVEKGSIAINGTSLTISALHEAGQQPWFEVSLIPTTLRETMLSELRPGDAVNLETDIIGRYVQRYFAVAGA